jgi:hypothetical protein
MRVFFHAKGSYVTQLRWGAFWTFGNRYDIPAIPSYFKYGFMG